MSNEPSQIPVTAPTASPREVGRKERLRRWRLVLALLVAVIAVDQAAKWWAWRHVSGANINPGGDFLTGPTVGNWYVNPVAGALLDLMGFGLVSVAVTVLARRPRQAAVTVCGSLMVGGWASNLLDRLGMHYLTAPGSIRGAVDFISAGGHSWNVADFVIIGTTPLFLLATADPVNYAAKRAARPATPARCDSRRVRMPIAAAAGAALITTVALGATHDGRLARPLRSSQLTSQSGRLTPGRSQRFGRRTISHGDGLRCACSPAGSKMQRISTGPSWAPKACGIMVENSAA
jgi:lipoprotein signal peptidase